MFKLRTSELLALLLASAAATSTGLVALEPVSSEPQLPKGWVAHGLAPREQKLELTFAVRQQGLEELHAALMRVSVPSSPDYGKHLSNAEVHALTAPESRHVESVLSLLRSYGAEPTKRTSNGDFITAVVPVKVAEQMLSAKYVELHHAASGVQVLRAPAGYALPPEVADALDFVSPTVHVPGVWRPTVQRTADNTTRFGFNTPKNLRELYSVGDAEGKAAKNKQAVTAFLEQGFGQGSLKRFWKKFCSGIVCGKGNPKMVGDAVAGSPGVESMLDIETITGVAGNIDSEFWGFKGRSPDNPENEPFMKWLIQLSSTSDEDVPRIFSTSYGEDEGSWSYRAAQRLNAEFQKAGTRGISLLFASGDEGANCERERFVPEGPGSSPYVTAVGGTAPTSSWPKPGSEKAIGLSSGGFSNYWPMPDWQKDAVAAYLKQEGLPGKSAHYNTSGRAYPDVSAQATNFYVIAGLPQPGVAGTSCASPTAAGLFSLLNDVRMQAGKPSLGFLNPFIYQNAAAFHDVTTGSSSGCSFRDGWPAKKGWDAVTGVGTPNYAALAKIVDALPAPLSHDAHIVV